MKKSRKIIWKLYSVFFTFLAIAHFLIIISPEKEPYVFYHILITWSCYFKLHYYLAVLKTIITLVCLYPLWAYSFNNESSRYLKFWQWILVLRIIIEIVGSYYEFVCIKATYYMIFAYGLSVTGATLLPLFPSYTAHYLYAFHKYKQNSKNR